MSGTFESLMMHYGAKLSQDFEMIKMKDMLIDLDPTIPTWANYKQSQIDMIPSQKFALLQQ